MKFILALMLSILVALFAIQNSEPIDINIFFYTVKLSQALVILISTIVGAIIAFSLGILKQLSLSKELREQNKTIRSLESELSAAQSKLGEMENKLMEQATSLPSASVPIAPYELPESETSTTGSENPETPTF